MSMKMTDEMKQTFLKVLRNQTEYTKIIIDRLRNRDREVVNYDDYYFVSEDDYNMEKETYWSEQPHDASWYGLVVGVPLAIVFAIVIGILG